MNVYISKSGLLFNINIDRDDYFGEPWENGYISMKRYYDFAATMKIAKRDGQRAYKAVMSDYEYLRAWCSDDWHYVVVTVTHGENYIDSCGGYEWDFGGEMSKDTMREVERMCEQLEEQINEDIARRKATRCNPVDMYENKRIYTQTSWKFT